MMVMHMTLKLQNLDTIVAADLHAGQNCDFARGDGRGMQGASAPQTSMALL
jgi:hypothetical protein